MPPSPAFSREDKLNITIILANEKKETITNVMLYLSYDETQGGINNGNVAPIGIWITRFISVIPVSCDSKVTSSYFLSTCF